MLNVVKTDIEGLIIIEPPFFEDRRGYFSETWRRDTYAAAGISCEFVQDNESKSRRGVLRGLHWQAAPHTQAKLVHVISGCVLDIAVDIRKGSPTYGRHVAVELSGENHRQLFIPRGFAHGFSVLSEEAVFQYKCDNYYAPAEEGAIAWNDPDLGIDWGIPADKVRLSAKDAAHPTLKEYLQNK